jgi:hypothetical protein
MYGGLPSTKSAASSPCVVSREVAALDAVRRDGLCFGVAQSGLDQSAGDGLLSELGVRGEKIEGSERRADVG